MGYCPALNTAPADLASVAPNWNIQASAELLDNWPIRDVLARLAEAATHLLTDHDCDAHGYEGLQHAVVAARAYTAEAQPPEQLIDEVQHRMDQVVEAAVDWHQSDDDNWMDNADRLGSRIDSLLELRSAPVDAVAEPPTTEIDLEWALRELADGWIASNQREGEYGFYQNARRVLTAVANDATERQREVDAKIAENRAKELGRMATAALLDEETVARFEYQSATSDELAAAIRAGKQ